jgi:ABC-type uncharacterized transport system permease subunit
VKIEMVLLWLRVAAILYAAAAISVFPAALHGVVSWRKTCVHLAGMAFFFHFVSAVEMLIQAHNLAHHWVPVGEREVESLLGLAVASVFFIVWWLYEAISLGIFALPFTFPSEGVRTSWLMVHISALLVSHVALGFSLLASVLYLYKERQIKQKPKSGPQSSLKPGAVQRHTLDWLPPLDTLERIAHATLEFGFPCLTVGLLIGSVLAKATPVAAAYFRDPKVVASFVLWVVYVALLLVRRRAGLRGRRAVYLSGAVFLAMLLVLAANFISQVHRFALR